MFNIGPWELGIILLVALIVVGPGKLPEVAKAIGKGINEFKKVTTGYQREFQAALSDIEKTVKEDIGTASEEKPGGTIDAAAANFESVVQAPAAEAGPAAAEAAPPSGQ